MVAVALGRSTNSPRPHVLHCDGFMLLVVLSFRDRVSLCVPGWPGTWYVDQFGLELTGLPASVSLGLGLKECTTMLNLVFFMSFCLPS